MKDTSDINVVKRGFACVVLRGLGSKLGRNGWKISFYSRSWWNLFINFIILFYLFIFRERGREGEREGEKHQCVVPLARPLLGAGRSGLQPGHVPWLGIKPVTLWFTGQHSIHWATPARHDEILRKWKVDSKTRILKRQRKPRVICSHYKKG